MRIWMKSWLLLVAGLVVAVGTTYAQTSDKNSLGFFSISGYPTCMMPIGYKTYSLVSNNNIPIEPFSLVDRNIRLTRMKKTNIPEGADVVLLFEDVFERSSDIRIDDDRHEKRRRKPGHPAPPLFMGYGNKEMGFVVTVFENVDDRILFTDTIYNSIDFTSDWNEDPKVARKQTADKMKAYTIENMLEEYSPTLNKILGTTRMSTTRLHAYSVKTKKKCKIDYSDLKTAFDKFEEASKIIDKDDWNIDAFKVAAESSMKTWMGALEESNLSDGKAKINRDITAAIYYNVATYYLMTKDFDIAKRYFKKSDETDSGFGDAAAMANMMDIWHKAKTKYEKMMSQE